MFLAFIIAFFIPIIDIVIACLASVEIRTFKQLWKEPVPKPIHRIGIIAILVNLFSFPFMIIIMTLVG